MISVVIPTLNAAARLPRCLDALVAPAVNGLVKEVIVVDAGSADDTANIADGFGAVVLTAPPSRGGQLKKGAEAAKGDWLLFLHGDTVLEQGWAGDAHALIAEGVNICGVFTLKLDAKGFAPKVVSAGAMWRTNVFKSPYGDQGLLISRKLYDAVDGYKAMPLFEDVDIIKRLIKLRGRSVLRVLPSTAITSAEKYEKRGYARSVLKNAMLVMRYQMGADAEALAKVYR